MIDEDDEPIMSSEIFITSLSHGEAFLTGVSIPTITTVCDMLSNTENINVIFVEPLRHLCKQMLSSSNDVLLNPALTCRLDECNEILPADADLVIGDHLIDIKCTIGAHESQQILQLLGYASLLKLNPSCERSISFISILNLLDGTIQTYDVHLIKKDSYINLCKLLTNTRTDKTEKAV